MFIYKLMPLLLFYQYTNSLILSGKVKTSKKDWILLSKFCFVSEISRVEYSIDFPLTYGSFNILFYYDMEWPNVYPKPELTCDNREHQISPYRILNLTESYNGCYNDKDDVNNVMVRCSSIRKFIGSRPRYWYIVLSNCFPTANFKGMEFTYKLNFTNGGGPFTHQFSADEFGILETSIAMFTTYCIIFAVTFLFARILYKKNLLHITFKFFIASIFMKFICFLLFMAEYSQFSASGRPTLGMQTLARLFGEISDVIFLVMLILVAKGYTITRGKLRRTTLIKLIVVFILYLVAIIVTFLLAEFLYDEGVVAYFYNSGGGIALIVVRLALGWLWFIYAVIFTIKNYPEKRKFYILLTIFLSIWFLVSPIIILTSSYAVADHVRQFLAFIVQSLISFYGHFIFLILVRPTAGNKLFPYHMKVNSVGLLKGDPEGCNNFPHHEPDKGGNTVFENENHQNPLTNITDIFMVDRKTKYQVEELPNFTTDSSATN